MAKFANVHSVRYFQTTEFTHLHRMSNLIDYIRSMYQNCGKDTRLMTLPQDGARVHISIINYFTRFSNDILQHTIDFKKIIPKPTCSKVLPVFHLLSFMGKKGSEKGYAIGIGLMSAKERTAAYENGIGIMSAKKRMAAYENGIGVMPAEARMAASEKGHENGIGVMQAEDRTEASEKGYVNGIGVMQAEYRTSASEKG